MTTITCELKLQQENTILNKVRNLNWDFQHKPPGFVIQLRVRHILQNQNNPVVHTTSSKPDMFLYVDHDQFLSYDGVMQCLCSILAEEGIPVVDAHGQFLNQSCFRLLLPTSDGPLIWSQAGRICTLSRLTELVLDQARSMNCSHNNRFMKFLPLAMDLTVVRNRQLRFRQQRVDESVILMDQSLEANKSKRVELVKLEEWRIKEALTEENCAICLDNFASGQLAARTPCLHIFHKKCIAPWLLKSHACPLCRADLAKPA